eukprot:6189540-Pleurochrysis_carterae.AAC.2
MDLAETLRYEKANKGKHGAGFARDRGSPCSKPLPHATHNMRSALKAISSVHGKMHRNAREEWKQPPHRTDAAQCKQGAASA